jgi:hypothetical protein
VQLQFNWNWNWNWKFELQSGAIQFLQPLAELVAILTAEYVSKLVRSAVDAHDILTNGMGGILPPRPFKRRKKVQDWDEPLPIPKIKKPNEHHQGEDMANQKKEKEDAPEGHNLQIIQGFDIYSDRIRNTYATTPYMIGAQSFLFPCCHDAKLYNRVQDLKSMQSNIQSTVIDSTIIDFIREEEDGYDHLAKSAFSWMKTEGETGAGDEKRKENARRLAVRTGLDVQIPGIEDLLLPSSCLNAGDDDKGDM